MEKTKIILIDLQGRLFANLQDIKNNQIVLPIGLMYLSSYLKSKLKDVEIRIVKSFVDFQSIEDLLEMINQTMPDIIGIRCLSLDKEYLLECAVSIRENYQKTSYRLMLGGPITNANTGEVAEWGLFDHIFIGDGERAFYQVVEDIIQKRDVRKGIKGLLYEDGQYEKDYIENLDELPFPDYDALDLGRYDHFINYGYNRLRQGVLLTSRGCPYKCIYCHNIFGNKARLRTAENIFNEIEYLYRKYDIRDFFIIDDIFNIDYQRAIEVFKRIIGSGFKIRLYFPNGIRGDIIDKNYIDYMVEAGTVFVTYAVETASQGLQKRIRKYIDLEKLRQNIIYSCEKNILVNAFFLFGFPGETEEEAILTLKYAESLEKLNFPFIFFARYYPGTEMYELARQEGFSEEMLSRSTNQLYHNVNDYCTPTLSNQFVNYIKDYFLYKILLNEKRVMHMLNIQSQIYENEEIVHFINSMYNMKVKNIDQFKSYIQAINKSNYIKRLVLREPGGSEEPIIQNSKEKEVI
ncbi:MAG: B12-binding domain-containing radical SAM protein [Clostridia bacterium]|nr:B12-binding domain-containing radical SAM protein [Clostridia bacterium]